MTIAPFVFAAVHLLVPGRDHDALDRAIIARVDAEAPLFRDDADKRKTAAWLVAIAYRESSLRLDAVGDHGQSLCAFQVGRSSGGTDAMLIDADACVGAAFPILRTSLRLCPAFPLAWYAAGGDAARACTSTRAQRISRDRSALAARLVREVALPEAASLFLPERRHPFTAATPRDTWPRVIRRPEEPRNCRWATWKEQAANRAPREVQSKTSAEVST